VQQAAVDIADFAAAADKPVVRFAERDSDVHPAFEAPAAIVHTAKQCVPDPNEKEVPTHGHPPKVPKCCWAHLTICVISPSYAD
jgi:hypothetical protein